MTSLERLDIGSFPINPEALDALESLPRLKTLWIDPQHVDEAVQKRLALRGRGGPPYTLR
jgi:hypothetical protein